MAAIILQLLPGKDLKILTKNQILKKYFGYDTFREGQEEVIDTILPEGMLWVLCLQGQGNRCVIKFRH